MATRVELQTETIRDLIKVKLASLKRARNAAQPHYQAIYDKDIAELQKAENTLTEIK